MFGDVFTSFIFYARIVLLSLSPVSFTFTLIGSGNGQYLLMQLLILYLRFINGAFNFQGETGIANKDATLETKHLFTNLRIEASRGKTLIGMADSTISGEFLRVFPCGPYYYERVDGYNNDLREVCGQGPGIYGFDLVNVLGEWPRDSNPIMNPNVTKVIIREHIKKIYKRGGITTLHWHMNNPINDDYYFKPPREIWQAIPPKYCDMYSEFKNVSTCGHAFPTFEGKYIKVVQWFNTLLDDNNVPIPIIFRALHEQNGDWFWWGGGKDSNGNGPDFDLWQLSYRLFWKYLKEYHAKNGINNVLWATAPNGGVGLTKEEYIKYAPDLEHVDILGYDFYGDFSQGNILKEIRTVVTLAEENRKAPAVTEQGYNDGTRSHWPPDIWTNYVLGPVLDDFGAANRIGYILMWYNLREDGNCERKYWGPHKNHENALDYIEICKRNDVIMEGEYKFYDPPSETFVEPPAYNDPDRCTENTSTICTGNDGRGYGPVERCDEAYLCGTVNSISGCKCRISGDATASNGYPYCLSNDGCGFGEDFACQGGLRCAKTDETYAITCVAYCPNITIPLTCPNLPPTCMSNNGRGDGKVIQCNGMLLCSKEDKCDCKISGNPSASNGINYCLSNNGCGEGTFFPCGGGSNLTCAKTDLTYTEVCVSYCPWDPNDECPELIQSCQTKNGRGLGGVFECPGGGDCAQNGNGCNCKIVQSPRPTAVNGIPYCLTNHGCGYGDTYSCGDFTCAKGDSNFTAACVSQC